MMLSKFLDPKNDFAFKRIFGTEKNKDILIHFLNDMITFKERAPIQEVTFLKTTQDPETAAHKISIVDVLCKDEKGHQYVVEMQVVKEKEFEKRAQYYASKAYISQAHAGGEYEDLKEIIFLAITEFVVFPKKKQWKSDHIILDKDSYENDSKDFSFTFLELPKFHKNIDELSNIVDKWAYFFKYAGETSERDLPKLVKSDEVIEKAYEELNRFFWNEEELRTYDQANKYERIHHAQMAQKFDDGFERGVEMGIEKGIEKGKVEGKIERDAEIIRNMIEMGFDLDAVAAATGHSLEDIQKLISEKAA